MSGPSDVTPLLERIERGDFTASAELLPLVYGELRTLAAAKMARESAALTLQPTALVHEAWLRLGGGGDGEPAWKNRAHFFGAAAEAMRRILVEQARRRRALRHGGGQKRSSDEEIQMTPETGDPDRLVAIHEAMEKFAGFDPAKAEFVKLRYFGGFTLEDAADALAIPHGTAKRWWTYARAWFIREIGE